MQHEQMTELQDIRARIDTCKRQLHQVEQEPSMQGTLPNLLARELEQLSIIEQKLVSQPEAESKRLWVFSVLVDPIQCQQRVQPVYYLGMHSQEAYRRKEEQIVRIDERLVQEREEAYAERFGRRPRRFYDIKVLKVKFQHRIKRLLHGLSKHLISTLSKKLMGMLGLEKCSMKHESESTNIVNLVGESGCGKSTMVAALANSGNQMVLASPLSDGMQGLLGFWVHTFVMQEIILPMTLDPLWDTL